MKRVRILAMLLAPVLLIAIAELALRWAGYGYDARYFIPVPGRQAVTANRDYFRRFIPRSMLREPVEFSMEVPKPSGTFRIVVVGGSAAAGVPDAAFGFPRILEVMLRHGFPERRFEVINTASVAVNSHVTLPIVREAMDYAPDLFLVYLGNNEVVGPYGAGSIFRGRAPGLAAIRLEIASRRMRLGQWLAEVWNKTSGREEPAGPWRGMEMFMHNRVTLDSPELARMYRHYERNLADLCRIAGRRGVPVLLCTVPVNLRDCPPFASVHGPALADADVKQWEQLNDRAIALQPRDPAQALALLEKAAALDPAYADLHFRRGQCLMKLGRPEAARAAFSRARDLDALRYRADSKIVDITRGVARRFEPSGVRLADLVGYLASEVDIPGDETFYEHVHLRFEGNYEVAHHLFDMAVPLLAVRSGGPAGGAQPSIEQCARELGFSAWHRYAMAQRMYEMITRPPFDRRADYQAWMADWRADLAEQKSRLTPGAMADFAITLAQQVHRRPDDLLLRTSLASLVTEAGNFEAAGQQWRALSAQLPTSPGYCFNLGAALHRQGKLDEAIACYEDALRLDPVHVRAHINLGNALLQRDRVQEAIVHLQAALRIEPLDAAAQNNLGAALLRAGQFVRAEEAFRAALRLEPGYTDARANLGAVLVEQGQMDTAIDEFRQATSSSPDSVQPHFNLARLYERRGDRARAVEQLRELVRLAPEDPAYRYRLGAQLAALGRLDEAAACMEQALARKPGWAPAAQGLAQLKSAMEKRGGGGRGAAAGAK